MTPIEAVTVLARSVAYSSHGANEVDREAIAVLQDHFNVPVDRTIGNYQIRGGFLYQDGKVLGAISKV